MTSQLVEETGEKQRQVTGTYLSNPGLDSNPASGERQQAISAITLNHMAIRAGHVETSQGYVINGGVNHQHTLTSH